MAGTIICATDQRLLTCEPATSDRFVYSRCFVPYLLRFEDGTPILDVPAKITLAASISALTTSLDPLSGSGSDASFMKRVFNANGLTLTKLETPEVTERTRATQPILVQPAQEGLIPAIVSSLFAAAGGLFLRMAGVRYKGHDRSTGVELVSAETETDTDLLANTYRITDWRPKVRVIIDYPGREIDEMLQIMKSNVGFLFLDRTRIRPCGFALGEHVYSLSLAPGEEIVLEQKTFTKRQETLEDETQLEREFNLEMSSTLTTELQEGMQRQQSVANTIGLTVGSTVGMPVEGVNISESVGGSDTITAADVQTTSQSLKQSHVASSKVAAKYRALHKTVFKLATEQGFESTSKRVIRNPNRFTPATIHYFKILQTLNLRQERYGVRLAWTPCVNDPSGNLWSRIADGRRKIIEDAQTTFPVGPPEVKVNNRPPISNTGTSGPGFERLGGGWGLKGGYRGDFNVRIECPSNYQWDGDSQVVMSSVGHNKMFSRNMHAESTGSAWQQGKDVVIPIHAGVDDCQTQKDWEELAAAKSFSVFATARFVPVLTSDEMSEQAAYAEWLEKQNALRDRRGVIMKEARELANTWAAAQLADANPLTEIIGSLVNNYFPANTSSDWRQTDIWQKIFDWEMASYQLYPSWWRHDSLRDPTRSPTDFLNASFAKVYLPVRAGYERVALRYIHGGMIDQAMAKEFEERFEVLEKELNDYRDQNFGPGEMNVNLPRGSGHPMTDEDNDGCPVVNEKFLCLGQWKETLPTDGTHAEIVLGMTNAADEFSKAEAETFARRRTIEIDNLAQDLEIKKGAVQSMQLTAPAVSVAVTNQSSGD